MVRVRILYRQPRYVAEGLDAYLPRLRYPRLLWSRFSAWLDADRHGGYEKVHDDEFWAYTYEPERKMRWLSAQTTTRPRS